MIYSQYEYIPREIEVEELQYFPTADYWIFSTGYYRKVKVKKTIYEKYKKLPKQTGFGCDLIKCQ